MDKPRGISPEVACFMVALLDLVLATPGIDEDTERRCEWLRMRMTDCAPQLRRVDKGIRDVLADLQREVAAA